jgi:hypothetical protein
MTSRFDRKSCRARITEAVWRRSERRCLCRDLGCGNPRRIELWDVPRRLAIREFNPAQPAGAAKCGITQPAYSPEPFAEVEQRLPAVRVGLSGENRESTRRCVFLAHQDARNMPRGSWLVRAGSRRFGHEPSVASIGNSRVRMPLSRGKLKNQPN